MLHVMRGGTFPAMLVISAVATGCGLAPPVAEPPPECNFVEGTALILSGRSTTQALGVTEVPGDPMRNDPADIYITRDEFDEGDLRGRLVCAIYTGMPGFVEVTVVPEGWQPPTGEAAEAGPTADPSPPSSGLPPRTAARSAYRGTRRSELDATPCPRRKAVSTT